MRHIGITLLLVAALGLSACGRKGPLAPPPGSAAASLSDVQTGAV